MEALYQTLHSLSRSKCNKTCDQTLFNGALKLICDYIPQFDKITITQVADKGITCFYKCSCRATYTITCANVETPKEMYTCQENDKYKHLLFVGIKLLELSGIRLDSVFADLVQCLNSENYHNFSICVPDFGDCEENYAQTFVNGLVRTFTLVHGNNILTQKFNLFLKHINTLTGSETNFVYCDQIHKAALSLLKANDDTVVASTLLNQFVNSSEDIDSAIEKDIFGSWNTTAVAMAIRKYITKVSKITEDSFPCRCEDCYPNFPRKLQYKECIGESHDEIDQKGRKCDYLLEIIVPELPELGKAMDVDNGLKKYYLTKTY